MVWNDTTLRQGLVQEMEDICGLGATGITGNTVLFQQFTRWANVWNKLAFNYGIQAFDGHDMDDPNYTTDPSGTFTGVTTREYNFDLTYKLLKIKLVNVTYDGTNYQPAYPFDDNDKRNYALNDPNIDSLFPTAVPVYDLTANGFKLYPKFTAAQVSAGAAIYVEWYRIPREYATTGTDAYESGLDLPFQTFPAIGASYEYAKLYKPDLATRLALDLYGNGGSMKGMIVDLQEWYSQKSPTNNILKPVWRSSR